MKAIDLKRLAYYVMVLSALLALLFQGIFTASVVMFSNDGPTGVLISQAQNPQDLVSGPWNDLNSLGVRGANTVNVTTALRWMMGPIGFAKFYTPLSLLFLGVAAWTMFTLKGLSPMACTIGGLAFPFNSLFFSTACWGVASNSIAVGCTCLAIGLLHDQTSFKRWARCAVAGTMVGLCVADAADVGAMLAIFVALYVVYQATLLQGTWWTRAGIVAVRLALVVVMAMATAAPTVISLWETQVRDFGR